MLHTWRELWHDLGGAEPSGVFEELKERYSEPHRAYHNMQHIEECFYALAPEAHLAEHLAEVEIAIWFHDAIYDPHSSNNEQASADRAREAMVGAGCDAAAVDRVYAMIMTTRHSSPGTTIDQQLVADVDLAILAAPRARFEEYESQIREEYGFIPDAEFMRRRAEILEDFVARPAIYQTAAFRARLETAARANIERSRPGGSQ